MFSNSKWSEGRLVDARTPRDSRTVPATPATGNRLRRFAALSALGALLALAPTAPASAQLERREGEPLDERESYAFARTIEGEATVAAEGRGIGETLEQNQPLLTGDRVSTGARSRLEILLPDRNRLQLDRSTTVHLDQLAYSGDRDSRVTVLVLEEGEILLQVTDEALGDELPSIETDLGTVYIQEPGTYRLTLEADGWLELVTREGFAELVTDRGSSVVRAGEAAEIGGDRWGRIEISDAGPIDALEDWSEELVSRASRSRSTRYVDGNVAYASSALDDAGDWIVVERVNYWRPRVSVGWRPYWDGRWAWTPSGYTWVSYEPWGWVPYHYGRWCMVNGYGWVWRPGPVYSPAWVYWHWSDGYAGWAPTGFYTDFYSPWYRGGFRFGFYGWAGGSWGHYSHWNFAPVHCFRGRNFRGHMRSGLDLQREKRWPEMPRGLLTTDTRDFRPDRIDRTDQLLHKIRDRELGSGRGELPDVTDFVGRKRDLPPTVSHAIVRSDPRDRKLDPDTPVDSKVPGWRGDRGKTEVGGGRNDSAKSAEVPRLGNTKGTPRDGGEVTGKRGSSSEPRQSEVVKGAPRVDTGKRSTSSEPRKDAVVKSTPRLDTGKGETATQKRQSTPAVTKESPRVDSGSRQGWKESAPSGTSGRSRSPKAEATPDSRPKSSAPVGRVVDSTRRATPKAESNPDYGNGAATRSTRSKTPSARVFEGPPTSAPSTRSSEGKGRSSGSPSYDVPRSSRVKPVPESSSRSNPGARSAPAPRRQEKAESAPRTTRAPAQSKPGYGTPSQPTRQPSASSAPRSSSSPKASSSPRGNSGGSAKSSTSGSRSSSSGSSKSSGGSSKSSSSGDKKD